MPEQQKLKASNPFLNGEVQPLPPDAPLRPNGQSIVHISREGAWWLDHKNQVICGLGAGALLLLGLVMRGASDPAGQYASWVAQIDKSAIVSGAVEDASSAVEMSLMQIDDFQAQLLSQEAQRFYAEAQKQTTDPNAKCFRQSIECPLDQFTLDAVEQIEQARNKRDWQTMMLASMRVKAAELARSGSGMVEPEVSLTQVAISDLVERRQQLRSATAEAKAAELREVDQ